MMLLLGTAMFAVFFFLTLFTQTVLGFSPVKAGVAWVPFPLMIIVISMIVARVLLVRIGVRPLLLAGPLLAGIGFMWLSQLRRPGPTGPTCWRRCWWSAPGWADVRAADADGRLARAQRRGGRRLRRAERGPADGRRDRPGGDRDDRLDGRRNSVQAQVASGAGAAAAGGREGPSVLPIQVLYQALTEGFRRA